MLDIVEGRNEHLGCEKLAIRVTEIKPLIHTFGHIHSGHGLTKINETTFINASICTERYHPTYRPIVVDLSEVDGTFGNLNNYIYLCSSYYIHLSCRVLVHTLLLIEP